MREELGPYDIPSQDEILPIVDGLTTGSRSGVIRLAEPHRTRSVLPFVVRESKPWPKEKTHRHEYLELIYVLSGRGSHQVGDRIFTVAAGQIIFLETSLAHRILSVDAELVYANIAFRPEALDPACSLENAPDVAGFFLIEPFFRAEDPDGGVFVPEPRTFVRLSSLATMLCDSFARNRYTAGEEERALLKALLLATARERSSQLRRSAGPEGPNSSARLDALDGLYPSGSPGKSGRDGSDGAGRGPGAATKRRIVEEIVAAVDDSLAEGFRVADIAGAVGLGYTRAAELFKELRGETIVEYANKRRVETAQHLLESTDSPIARIALDAGFNDLAHFNRIFKRRVGVTPGAYRSRRISRGIGSV